MATPRLCSDIQLIDKTECIGNSLVKINRNFSSLHSDVCGVFNTFNPLVSITGLIKGTGTTFVQALENVDYYKPGTVLAYPLTITGNFSCGNNATVTGDATVTSNLTVGNGSKPTYLRLTGELRVKDIPSGIANGKGSYIIGNQLNSGQDNPGVEELAINYVGFNAGITQFRNFNVYNGKKQSLFFINGSTGNVTIGTSPGSNTELLTVYGNINVIGSINGGVVNSKVNTNSLSSIGANDGDVLTYVVQNIITTNPTTTNPTVTPSTAKFNYPTGIALDPRSNILYVADYNNHAIRKINLVTREVSVFAGLPGQRGYIDSVGPQARFQGPTDIVFDQVNECLYVSDSENHVIRKITIGGPSTPFGVIVTTIAGIPSQPGYLNGIGSKFYAPKGLAVDRLGENLYVADTANNCIRKIVLSTRTVSLLAGKVGSVGNKDGFFDLAEFKTPMGITIDPEGTNLYVADYGNGTIRKIVISTKMVSTIAGIPNYIGTLKDGIGISATFRNPTGIAFARSGANIEADALFITDSGYNNIRYMNIRSGAVSLFAGSANGTKGSNDAAANLATFYSPQDLVCDNEFIYVVDQYNHTIRTINRANGNVTLLAGIAGNRGTTDGPIATTTVQPTIPLVTRVGSWVPRPMTIELPSVANDKDILTYNATTKKWIAGSQSSIALDKLSTNGATAGNVIKYNSTTQQWAPGNADSPLPPGQNNQVLTYDNLSGGWTAKNINDVFSATMSLKKNEISTTANVATYNIPISSDSNPENYLVYLNGVMQSPGTDFTISSNGKITLIPAPAGNLKLTVLAVKNSVGIVNSTTSTTPTNKNLTPGAEGQVLTYTNSEWKGVAPSVLPSQIKQEGATAGQILSYNGNSWVPINNTPSISPVQLQQAGAKNGQVLMFNSTTNTWGASSLPITNSTNNTNNNEPNVYINTNQTSIWKLCEQMKYNNPNTTTSGFGFIDSNYEARVFGLTQKDKFGDRDVYANPCAGTMPLPEGELAEKLYVFVENVMVITKSGNLYISGRNSEGQCAQNNEVQQPTLVKALNISNVKEVCHGSNIATDAQSFYALTNDGKLYAWGYNQYGALGDGTTTQRLVPILTLGPGNTYGNPTQKVVQALTIPGWNGSSTPTTGAALLEDGSVWCVGYGDRGNLGDGSSAAVNSKWVRVKISADTFLTNIKKICGAGSHGYSTIWALDNDGVIFGWGRGEEGQIGDNNNSSRSFATRMYTSHITPSPVFTDFVPVYGDSGHKQSIFLKHSNGNWYGVGYNGDGNLGIGSTTNVNRPTLITALVNQNIDYITGASYGGGASFAVGINKLFATGNNNNWNWLGTGTSTNLTTFTRIRIKTNSTVPLDVRPIYGYGHFHSTLVFSPTDRKLYLAGCNFMHEDAGSTFGSQYRLVANFKEITRGVV